MLSAALLLALALIAAGPKHTSAEDPSLAIDVGTSGNTGNAVGEIEDCISVATGEQFEVDVLILEVTDLLAWEIHLDYDPAVLTVVDHDVKLFQGANEGSSPIDISARLPNHSGFHTLSAFESSDPPRVDSGSGVLARVTLEATADGETEIALGQRDINNDDVLDRGTLMRDVDAAVIGDTNEDNFFDGEVTGAIAVVGDDCPPGYNVATPASSDPGDTQGWLYAAAAGMIGVIGVAAVVAIVVVRRRST